MKFSVNPLEKPAPPRRERRRLISPKLLLIWLAILALECTGVTAIATFWVLTPGQGLALSAPALFAPTPFLLPEPTLPSEPTSTATRAVIYLPTPTKTTTALPPTQTPTAIHPPVATPKPAPTETPAPAHIEHVVIISIDGLRPDALFAADAPNLDKLIARGAYSPNAQTVKISETLPSHASMLTGVFPEKHGIQWGVPYIGWPGLTRPTLFSLAHEAGLSTAMVFGKQKLNYLVLPNSVDELFGADTHDVEVKDRALAFIEAGLPNILFIHFPDVDRVGHSYGWMSSYQLEAITFVDGLIGEIVAALDKGSYLDSTLLIVTADHGGHGLRHGDDSPEDRTIPWLAAGPGVPPGITLTTPINTYDTAPTALHALNLPVPADWDGKPILEIFSKQ
jgi:hypothetical protein